MNERVALLCISLCMLLSVRGHSQTIIRPSNDSTFIREFHDDDEWAIIAKEGFVVSLSNKEVDDNYGRFYQIRIVIQNLTDRSYTFDPGTIHATCIKNDNWPVALKVYSNKAFQKRIRKRQAWSLALNGIASGLNAAAAGLQTSYVSTTGYGGYSYLTPVTTYNHALAAQTNALSNMELRLMTQDMEQDRRIREEGYLKKNTIRSGEGISGFMNIKRVKGKEMRIVIPLNGTDFVFDWDVTGREEAD